MPNVVFVQAAVRPEDRRADRQQNRQEDRRTDRGDRGHYDLSSQTNGVGISIPTPLHCACPQTSSDAACPGHHASRARYAAMHDPACGQSWPVRLSSGHHRTWRDLPSY